jgi:hypothetical protein
LSEQRDVLCSEYHAEGLKYVTALQGLLSKLKKRKEKTFLQHCSAVESTAFVYCFVWWKMYEKYTIEIYNFLQHGYVFAFTFSAILSLHN